MKVCPVCERRYEDAAVQCPADGAPLVVVPAPRPDPMVDRVLGQRYRIVRRVGEGGMGCVYEARHATLGRRCALKVLRPELLADADAAARFRREAVAAGGLDHPNIVAVLDVGQDADGTAFLVMEYLDGRDLRHLLQEVRILPVARCIHIFRQICDAAGTAHAHGIVHRDLKPENVLLVHLGADPDHVKVLDFGVSKLAAASQKLTRTGFALGTPEYMSPEQALGRSDVDHRTDIYAIGVMLYEAVTGRAPISGRTPTEVLARLFAETPVPARQLNPNVAPALDAIIARAIDKERENRFESCAALSAALAALATDGDIALGATIQVAPAPPASVPAPPSTTAPAAFSTPASPPATAPAALPTPVSPPATAPAATAPSPSMRSVGPMVAPLSRRPDAPAGPSAPRLLPILAAAAILGGAAAATVVLLLVGRSTPPAAPPGAGHPALAPEPARRDDHTVPSSSPGSAGDASSEDVADVPVAIDTPASPAPVLPAPDVPRAPEAAPVPSVIGIRASAEFGRHVATNAIDGSTDTAWGVRGDPVGHWLEIVVAPPAPLRAVWLQTGFVRTTADGLDVFTANHRLREVDITVTGADGAAFQTRHTFADSRAWQSLPLPGPAGRPVATVRITIRSVYEGLRWKDTHVGEIVVDVEDGRPPRTPPPDVSTGTPGAVRS